MKTFNELNEIWERSCERQRSLDQEDMEREEPEDDEE